MMPIALTRRGWGVVLAAAALAAAWYVVGIHDMWYLVAFLAALVAVSIVYAAAIAAFGWCEVELTTTNPTPVSGESVVLSATVRQRGLVPLRGAVIWSVGGERVQAPVQIRRSSEETVAVSWKSVGRGPVRAAISSLVCVDPLGIAVRRVPCREGEDLLVLPRYLANFARRLGDVVGAGGVDDVPSAKATGINSGLPTGAVRAFRVGDALRQVHWKQSARQGELLVNLPYDVERSERTVFLSLTREGYDSADDVELTVSAAATAVAWWIRRGHPVRLFLGATEPIVVSTETEALRALATVPMTEGGVPAHGYLPHVSPAPDMVVACTVSSRLADELSESAAGGIVAAVRRGYILTEEESANPSAIGNWAIMAITPDVSRPDAARNPGATAHREARHD